MQIISRIKACGKTENSTETGDICFQMALIADEYGRMDCKLSG